MMLKTGAMGGAAAAVLAGTLMSGGSALAQSSGAGQMGQSAPPQSQMNSPMSTSASRIKSGEPLSQVQNAKQTLSSATLQDSSGQQVGTVSNVATNASGKPTAVDVSITTSVGQPKTVTIKATQLKYDASSNTLMTPMTADEISQLPAASAPSTGSP